MVEGGLPGVDTGNKAPAPPGRAGETQITTECSFRAVRTLKEKNPGSVE